MTSPSLHDLGIDRLSPEIRLQLIEQIWDTLSPDNLPEIPQGHREELDRRLAEADANPTDGSSWSDVKARLNGES